MNKEPSGIIAGFDCHLDNHAAVLINPIGQVIAKRSLPTTMVGYRDTIKWMHSFGPIIAIGVESTGSYGAGLSRYFTKNGLEVIEVNQPHRHTRAHRGKDDFIDAEAAARKVLSGEATAVAKDSSGIIETIRQLNVARNGAIKARSAALCQLQGLLTTSPAQLREQLRSRKTLEGKATICASLRPNVSGNDPLWAAKISLRSVARRIQTLSAETTALDSDLDRLVAVAAPTAISQLGIGTGHATTLLIAIGENVERFTSEGAFANLCGVAPKPASSGRTTRHRLNPGGNRQANRSLHMIVAVRLRYCDNTQAYMQRRLSEGRTKKEIIRCLKRYVARDIYRILKADLATVKTRLDNL